MGCLPGTEVILTHHAPFGDPIAIKVSGYTLSMRREEAATILLNHK
jgi:ferrous iron transport protein A